MFPSASCEYFTSRAEMIDTILIVMGAVYCFLAVLIAMAAILGRRAFGAPPSQVVSIIVAARNEEKRLPALLDSILQQTYPRNLLEVLVVDDRSTDRTGPIVSEYTQIHPHITLVSGRSESGHLRGKANALVQGIEVSSGEILMITDADCVVPPAWVEETVKHYRDERVGIVAGFTALRDEGWFSAMQSLDWLVLLTVASGAVTWGVPLTAIGNNLSVRRTAYDMVGGYRRIPFSVTEDYALFHAITSTARRTARFPLESRALVVSDACKTWRELYRQKKRWFTGGKDIELPKLLLFGFVYTLNALLLLGLALHGLTAILPALAFKVAADLAFALPPLHTFHRWRLLRVFPLFEVYFILYVVLFPLVLFSRSGIVWKERTFKE